MSLAADPRSLAVGAAMVGAMFLCLGCSSVGEQVAQKPSSPPSHAPLGADPHAASGATAPTGGVSVERPGAVPLMTVDYTPTASEADINRLADADNNLQMMRLLHNTGFTSSIDRVDHRMVTSSINPLSEEARASLVARWADIPEVVRVVAADGTVLFQR